MARIGGRFRERIDEHVIIAGLLANVIVLCSTFLPWGWQASFTTTHGEITDIYKDIGIDRLSSISVLYLPIICLIIGLLSLALIKAQLLKFPLYELWPCISAVLFLATGVALVYSLLDFARYIWSLGEFVQPSPDRFFTFGWHLGFILSTVGTILNLSAGILPMMKRKIRERIAAFLGLIAGIGVSLSLGLPWLLKYVSPLSFMVMVQKMPIQPYFGGILLLPFYLVAICSIFTLIGGFMELAKAWSGESYIHFGGIGIAAITILFIIFGGLIMPLGIGCWVALAFGIIAIVSNRVYEEEETSEEVLHSTMKEKTSELTE